MYRWFRKACFVLMVFCVSCSRIPENQQNTEKHKYIEISQADSFDENLGKLEIPESCRLKDITIGSESASLTVYVYTSFTCGYCKDFWINVFPKIYTKYIKTGKLKIIARNYLEDIATLEASMLIRCAAGANVDQNLKIAKKIYQKQEDWIKSQNPQQYLKNLFKKNFGFKNDVWANACLANIKLSAGIMLFQKEAFSKFKIRSVPSFIITKAGKVVLIHEGRISFETFDLYLSESLKYCNTLPFKGEMQQ